MIEKDSFVEIENIILEPINRSSNLPQDTKNKPFKMWAKGFLLEDSLEGSNCNIKTVNGRILKGVLKCKNPRYEINYGEYVDELNYIREQAKELIKEDGE